MPNQPNAKEAYDAGAKAKRSGFMRVSPYYEQPRADYWWLAGFDGIDFDLAAEKQPEFAISQDFCGYHTPVKQPANAGDRDQATVAAEQELGIFFDDCDLLPL